jgi:hypothetical protein
VAAILIVAAILAAAFVALGPPATQRAQALDRLRVRDVIETAIAIHNEFARNRELPQALDEPERDPVTGRAYEYRRLGGVHYLLCAAFALATPPADRWATHDELIWRHPQGRFCYRLDADRQYYVLAI